MGFLLLPHNELYYVIITKLNESESMLKPVIHGIFPTPLIFTNIEREFTKEELEFFDEQSKTTFKNEGNVTSLDNYLMRHDPMTTIKQEITSALQLYLDEIIKPKDDVKPYITQSWLNYTITFFNDSVYKQIKLFPKEWNLYNAESWFFTVKPGDIVVFPSSLIHMVEQKAGNNIRTSLAFNSFLRGAIGDKQSLTELLN